MMLSKKIFFFLLFIFQTEISFAQKQKNSVENEQYRPIHWSKDDGLPDTYTYCMFKDAKGLLWVGGGRTFASGLRSFDGSVFKKYSPGPGKRGSINSDDVYTFKEDSLHNVWMGTDAGISRYDIKADTFTNFSPVLDSAFRTSVISPFWSTKDEMYCIEPGGAITEINIHSLKRQKILQLSKMQDPGIQWNISKSFFDKGSKSFWFLYFNEEGGRRLEQIFLNGSVQFYTWPCYEGKANHGHHGHNAEDMCYDPNRNSVWINSGEGLLEFSLTSKQFRRIEAWSKLTKQKSYDRGVGVDIDRQGRIWFSTWDEGIFIYDPETDQTKPVFFDHDTQLKTGEANLYIYCDRDGIVWTSDWLGKGIYALLPFNPPVKTYAANPSTKNALSSGLISTIVPGPQGKLWLGTADGLNIFDPVTETFEVLREKDLPGIKGTSIIPIYIDTIQQKAWLNAGSQKSQRQFYGMSMYEMDIKTRKCSRVVFMDGSKQIDTFFIQHDLVRPYKDGVVFCDELHGIFEIKKGSLVANLLIPLVPGGSGFGNILLAEDRYLFLDHGRTPPNFAFENKNGKWTRVPNVLDNLGWYSALYNKKDQTYWVGERDALVNYTKDFRVIKAYHKEDGYQAPMLTMRFDNYGNLWFANGSQQIGRLNTATGIFSLLSEADGYQKLDFDGGVPIAKDVRGDLYFGIGVKWGTSDLNYVLERISPERFSAVTSYVYFNTLFINQKPFSLNIPTNELEELSLKYNQDTIRIEAGIIDYYSGKKDKIRYKLGQNGKEGDWQYPPDHIIRYENLSPGSYRLVVQSSNINDEFNSPEKILLINISPAFWNTWWFRISAVLCIVAITYGLLRWRLQQRFRLQLERSEKEKQLAELQQQKTEMEMQVLRAQMNPHFIFNSLNSINRFILQKNSSQASEYLTKFSRLIRMILNSSANATVSLADDIEALQLYLELERLRCDGKFSFKIKCDPEIDPDFIQVPPMLLQPFVENAIWHGLMNKEDEGHLWINIDQQDLLLICTMTDDGIGRKRAAELRDKSVKHQSMGMKITESRIAMIQKINRKSVEIKDLVDAHGDAEGTEVVLKIPVVQ